LANAIEQRGFFWWFNEPARPANSKQSSVPGLLTVTQTGQVTLDLDGALAEDGEHADWSKPRSFGRSRIVGLLDTPGDYALLEGLERTDFSIAGDDSPKKQSFSANMCTRREFPFPDDYEQEGFIELRIDLKGLEEWLNLDSIVVETDYGYEDGARKTVTYTNHDISFPIPGGTISIESLTTGGDFLFFGRDRAVRDVKFEQHFCIHYRPDEPSDLSHLQYVFAKVEEFMALLLGLYFRFERPTFIRKEEPLDGWMTIYSHGPAPTTEPPNRFQTWLQFTDMAITHLHRKRLRLLRGGALPKMAIYSLRRCVLNHASEKDEHFVEQIPGRGIAIAFLLSLVFWTCFGAVLWRCGVIRW
jgi:hypothetical protein